MNQLLTSKVLTALVVVAIVGLGYFAYTSLANSTGSTSVTSPVSQELLIALSNLHTIELNGSVFSDPSFQSLNDFGVTIPLQPVGRRNPFQSLTGAPTSSGTPVPATGL